MAFCKNITILALLLASLLLPRLALAQDSATRCKGQVIMVPYHEHVLTGPKNRALPLGGELFLINPNRNKSLQVISIVLFDQEGTRVKDVLEKQQTLGPLASLRLDIPKNKSNGSVIIEWDADSMVNPLYVEALYVGTAGQQGISFTSQGRVIEELK